MPAKSTKKLFKSLLLNGGISSSNAITRGLVRKVPLIALRRRSDYYIVAGSSFTMSRNQYEACRKVLTRRIKRQKPKSEMKLFVRFTLPCTAKSKNARMGKGKGGVSSFVSRINELSPLFLLRNVNYICASRGAHDVSTKLPVHVLALKRDLVNKLVYSRSVVDKRKDLGTKVTKKRKGK